MAINQELSIYTKKVSTKDGKKYSKYLCKYKGTTLDLNMSEDVKKRLEKEMSSENYKFPITLVLSLERDDYFIPAPEKFTRNDGSQGVKYYVVLQNWQSMRQGEFDYKRSLDDVISED